MKEGVLTVDRGGQQIHVVSIKPDSNKSIVIEIAKRKDK